MQNFASKPTLASVQTNKFRRPNIFSTLSLITSALGLAPLLLFSCANKLEATQGVLDNRRAGVAINLSGLYISGQDQVQQAGSREPGAQVGAPRPGGAISR